MKKLNLAIGNCVNEELVNDLFGSVTAFAQVVEQLGDNFTFGNIKVQYDEHKDIHWFFEA